MFWVFSLTHLPKSGTEAFSHALEKRKLLWHSPWLTSFGTSSWQGKLGTTGAGKDISLTLCVYVCLHVHIQYNTQQTHQKHIHILHIQLTVLVVRVKNNKKLLQLFDLGFIFTKIDHKAASLIGHIVCVCNHLHWVSRGCYIWLWWVGSEWCPG